MEATTFALISAALILDALFIATMYRFRTNGVLNTPEFSWVFSAGYFVLIPLNIFIFNERTIFDPHTTLGGWRIIDINQPGMTYPLYFAIACLATIFIICLF